MAIPLSMEGYLRNKIVNVNNHQTDGKLNKLTDQYANIHNSEWLNEIDMGRKETESKVPQPAEFWGAEPNKTPQTKFN